MCRETALLLAFLVAPASAAARADVLYLDPAGNPEAYGIARFREAYDGQVRPHHPAAAYEHRRVVADTPALVAAALEPERTRPPKLIFTADTRIAQVVARELPAVPMVFLTLADPVLLGVSDDPIAPRANVTGFTWNTPVELKHIEILREWVPGVARIGVVSDTFWGRGFTARRLLADSESLFGAAVRLAVVESAGQVEGLARLGASERFDAWFVADTPFNRDHHREITSQLRASGKPWIAGMRFPQAPLVYAPERFDPWPRVGEMIRLVLSGVPARDIPFERPKRFQLIVNRPAARALGAHVPRSILLRAHEIID